MENKISKGLWRVHDANDGSGLHYVISDKYDILVARTCFLPRSEYNAKAISFVPEMLEFIKYIFEDYENGLIDDVEHLAIRAKLLYNKATTI